MNMKNILVLLLLATATIGCNDFVQSIDEPINLFEDQLLNDERETDFIITGVKAAFAQAYTTTSLLASGLSDELFFDFNVPGATYPQYFEIDGGDISFNNNSVIDADIYIGQLRLYADTLVGRSFIITYTDSSNMVKARYNGYLYGAIARYFYAVYFGLDPENGGGAINLSPFIPSATMLQLAMDRLDLALQYAAPGPEAKLVHSLKARINLILGKYTEAAAEADLGLASGDAPFNALFNAEMPNFWYYDAGYSRIQWVVDPRFAGYIAADSAEATRIEIEDVGGNDGATVYQFQIKYPEDQTPMPFITWQEMQLIKAEVVLRNNQSAEALPFINAVRTSHGLVDRTETALDSVYIERDKELFATGNRIIDQRRFDRWHLPAGSWKFLPITQRERNANPNF